MVTLYHRTTEDIAANCVDGFRDGEEITGQNIYTLAFGSPAARSMRTKVPYEN
jgi:hypothetical protein